jgi:hypothetical protein
VANNQRPGTREKIGFLLISLGMAAAMLPAFSWLWPRLMELFEGNVTLSSVVLAGYIPAAVYWLHSLLIAWETGFNRDTERKLQPVSGSRCRTDADAPRLVVRRARGPRRRTTLRGPPLCCSTRLCSGPR